MPLTLNKFQPSEHLAPFVLMYYTINAQGGGDSSMLFNNHPQGTMDIMFAIEGSINISIGEELNQIKLADIFTIGQQEQNFKVSFASDSMILGVVFKAESFGNLFNLPIVELTNKGLEIADELGPDYRNLLSVLRDTQDVSHQISCLESFFLQRLEALGSKHDHFDELVTYMRKHAGTVSIAELANQANMSVRTLQRKMTDRIGLGPKSYSKIIRFNFAMTMINHHPEMDWHDILFKCGYYDQMHFIKDFKQYTGQSPTQFVKGNTAFSSFFRER